MTNEELPNKTICIIKFLNVFIVCSLLGGYSGNKQK